MHMQMAIKARYRQYYVIFDFHVWLQKFTSFDILKESSCWQTLLFKIESCGLRSKETCQAKSINCRFGVCWKGDQWLSQLAFLKAVHYSRKQVFHPESIGMHMFVVSYIWKACPSCATSTRMVIHLLSFSVSLLLAYILSVSGHLDQPRVSLPCLFGLHWVCFWRIPSRKILCIHPFCALIHFLGRDVFVSALFRSRHARKPRDVELDPNRAVTVQILIMPKSSLFGSCQDRAIQIPTWSRRNPITFYVGIWDREHEILRLGSQT